MLKGDLGQPNTEPAVPRISGAALRDRYSFPRPDRFSRRLGLGSASINYHLQRDLTARREQREIAEAKALWGAGFDAPLEGRETSIPQYPSDIARAEVAGIMQTLAGIALWERDANRRLRRRNRQNPPDPAEDAREAETLRSLEKFTKMAESGQI